MLCYFNIMAVQMEFELCCEELKRESATNNHYVFEKSDCDYVYLKALVDKSSKTQEDRDPVVLKNFFLKCMASDFGEVNSLVPVDILKYDYTTNEVVLRCNTMIFQRLTNSILLNNSKLNFFRIQKVSYNNTLGLLFRSRGYIHSSKKNKKENGKCLNN